MESNSAWNFNAPQYYDFASPAVNDANVEDYFKIDHESINPQTTKLTSSSDETEISINQVGVGMSSECFSSPNENENRQNMQRKNRPLRLYPTVPITQNFLKRKPREGKHDELSMKNNYANKILKLAKNRINQSAKKEKKFPNMLRGFDQKLTEYHPTRTIPQPFEFHGKPKMDVKSGKVETLAEKCMKFSSRTPTRFRSKTSVVECGNARPKMTIPHTPKLKTKTRKRSVNLLSREEKEELEAEEACQLQFKAHALNRKILEQPSVPTKPPQKAPVVVKEFDLTKPTQKAVKAISEPCATHFTARPVPTYIWKGPIGVGVKKLTQCTSPHSPAFSKLHATRKKELVLPAVDVSMSSMSSPSEKSSQPKRTRPVPFSFDGRDQEARERKEKMLEEKLKNENEARTFVANPLPDMSVPAALPCKKARPPTAIEPFDLQAEKRSEESHKKWMEKLKELEKENLEMKQFKAQPASVLHQAPFLPERPNNLSCLLALEARHVPTHTEKRLAGRKEWEEYLKQKKEETEEQKKKRQELERQEEEKEMRKLRMQTVHQAQPIRHYNPIVLQPSQQSFTIPRSPEFSERISHKYLDKTLREDNQF